MLFRSSAGAPLAAKKWPGEKNKDAFSKEIEQSFIWCNPHLVIECEDETTDIYLGENKEMFDLMEEKRFVRR